MRIRFAFATLALLLLAASLAGCTPTEPEPEVQPLIAPPVIAEEGKLRVGVDLDYPPFAGTDLGREAGLDIDVAAAVAAELGLELVTVDVKPSDVATALAEGEVDVVMSIPFTDDTLVSTSMAGTYIDDGPAFFITSEGTGSVEPSMTIETLAAQKIGAQQDSASYWLMQYEFGDDAVQPYPTLREAMDALAAGEVEVVAGDAFVGAYIAGDDFESVRFAGQAAPATPLGIAAGVDAAELEEAVRGALDKLAADGVLTTIRTKWVGDLPELETEPIE